MLSFTSFFIFVCGYIMGACNLCPFHVASFLRCVLVQMNAMTEAAHPMRRNSGAATATSMSGRTSGTVVQTVNL